MKRMKKWSALALFVAASMGMCACGRTVVDTAEVVSSPETADTAEEETKSAEPASEEQEQAAVELDTSERVDLVFYVMGDAPQDEKAVEDALNEILLERLNATIDFQFSTWTDFQQKYSLEMTSGNADLIYIANWLNYGQLANTGAFEELDELLDTVAPALRDLVGEENLNMSRVGGSIYAIPACWPEYTCNGIKYREDLREKYDLPVPDSLENFEAYLLGIQENMPEQGLLTVTAQESTGLQNAFDAANILNLKYPWVTNNGLPYGLAADYNSPSEVYDYWYSDDFVEDMKLMKKWADLGFWSKSALSDTNNSESYASGLCVAEIAGQNPNKQITAISDFEKDHPDWKSEYIAYGEVTGVIFAGHATQNGTAIVRGCKNPERAIKVLELLMTDEEINKLVQCGIEGKHYELDEEGHYVNLDDAFTYEALNTWGLRNSEYKLVQKSDVILNEMFEKYEAIAAKTKFPNVSIYSGFSENYESYQAERSAVSNVMRQYLAPLQAGLVDDVEKAVEEFRQKAEEAGLQACRDGYTQQWLAYCEEYGYK